LQAAFENLKAKLAAEGLFAPERKRPIPSYPQCVGIVTSPTGAALRDVLHVVARRHPALRLILAACRVQGEGAGLEIAEAIRSLNEFTGVQRVSKAETATWCPEAILLTRGGGSLEDLWAFNEESVARAIAASTLPVISAVGHEIDFTISDFVADLRAATPSAAAEILTEGIFSSTAFVREVPRRLRCLVIQTVAAGREEAQRLQGRLGRAHPRRRLNEAGQRLDDLQGGVRRCVHEGLRRAQLERSHLVERLLRSRPRLAVERACEHLVRLQGRLAELVAWRHRQQADRLEAVRLRLQLLGPEQVLARGYSITTDAVTGHILREATQVASGAVLRTRLHRGTLVSRVVPPA
jgi:exodeoxyribonuclease VII large subunit